MSYQLSEFQREANDRRRGRRWINYHWRQSWRAWMNRRLPPASRIALTHKNIFISPSRAGFAYIGFCGLLLLIAINFQNSAVYGLTFLLMSVFVVSIFHTFRNLSGLELWAVPTEPVFAGNEALFTTAITTRKRATHFSLCLSWQDKVSSYFDVEPNSESQIALRYQVGPRGVCRPGRMKIETRYPFGLLSSRTYIDVQHEAVIYPYPVDYGDDSPVSEHSHQVGAVERPGSDDFYSLRDYQQGDKVKNIAWRSYAKNSRLVVKQFVDYFDNRQSIVWDQMHGNTEQRLSQICFWVIQAEARGEQYAIDLPGVKIEAGAGSAHLARILRELALFGGPRASIQPEGSVKDDISIVDLSEMLEGRKL